MKNNCKKPNNGGVWLLLMLPVLMLSVVLGLLFGGTDFSPAELWQAISLGDEESAAYRIFIFIRLPRVLAALLSGAALAVSGVLLQAILHNPLAGPNIIGVNNGAGLLVLLCAAFFPAMPALLPLAAFLGALGTALLVFALALRVSASQIALVLTGIALSSIFGAGINSILIVAPDVYTGASAFLVGGLAGISAGELAWPSAYIAVGLVLAFILHRDLNILALGDAAAQTLGVQVGRVRLLAIVAAAVLAGAAISFAGLISFVGLIVPHAVRFLIGADHRLLLPMSALAGGSFVILCDLAARTLFAPYELPVGILMSFIGGPFFIFLILRSRRVAHD